MLLCMLYMCPPTAIYAMYVSSYWYLFYECVLILLYMLHMCADTGMYAGVEGDGERTHARQRRAWRNEDS